MIVEIAETIKLLDSLYVKIDDCETINRFKKFNFLLDIQVMCNKLALISQAAEDHLDLEKEVQNGDVVR